MFDIDITSAKERIHITALLDCYGPLLTTKQQEAMELYFFDDLSLSEISEIKGISRQGVRDSIKTGIQILIESDTKLGFLEREKILTEKISKAKLLASQISERGNDAINEIINL